MELNAEELTLIELFREHAADRRRVKLEEEFKLLERDKLKHKEESHKREEKEEKEREQLVEATTVQIEAFHHELDDYDTATVHALMLNQEQLDAVRLRLDRSEVAAFHLADGRAVFKTSDNLHVFDKTGTELSRDVIRPEDIPKSAPSWESRKADQDAERDLLKQRDDIHAFQHKLDQARERSETKGLSADTLTKMDADLKASMPQAVRDFHAHPDAPQESAGFDARAAQMTTQRFETPVSPSFARPSPM